MVIDYEAASVFRSPIRKQNGGDPPRVALPLRGRSLVQPEMGEGRRGDVPPLPACWQCLASTPGRRLEGKRQRRSMQRLFAYPVLDRVAAPFRIGPVVQRGL